MWPSTVLGAGHRVVNRTHMVLDPRSSCLMNCRRVLRSASVREGGLGRKSTVEAGERAAHGSRPHEVHKFLRLHPQ